MFDNPRRGRQARNFTTNVLKILVLSSEQIFSRKLPLGAPGDLEADVSSISPSSELPFALMKG